MSEVFRTVLNAGFQGSIVIVAVLLLRLVLNRVPKKYICLLWILAGIRLLMPFSVESALSLQPEEEIVSQQQWQDLRDYGEILPENAPTEMPQPYIPQTQQQSLPEEQPESEVITRTALGWAVVPWIWLAGVGSMGVYSFVSWLLLKRRGREAVHLADDIWECSGLGTAFIMGFLRPRIYIPINISPESRRHILMHERCHLNRFDHWTKLGAFIALTIHWFNPVVWVFYLLLCRDIEMACDEAAVRDMSLEERKGYSAALLECSAGRMRWAVCPVAFGEVSVKQRILGVLHYRRPRFWLTVLGTAAIIFVAVCFLTSPVERIDSPTQEDWGITLETERVTAEGLTLSITQCGTLVHQQLYYGLDFHVERWNRETWEAVEPVIENWGFTMEAIQLPQNQTTRLEIDWEWLYGQLPAGTYRIGKSIHNDVRVPVGVNLPREEPPEEQNNTYYAVFEITEGTDGALFGRNALGTLLKDWDGEITHACLRSEAGTTCLSSMRELAEVMVILKYICYDPNRASQVTELRDVDEYRWYYSSIEFSSGEYLIFDNSFESVWAVNAAGTTAVYGIENPLAVQTFFSKNFDGVAQRAVVVAPFAGGDEPWHWAKRIRMDAVEEARLYAAEKPEADGNTVTVSSNSGIVSVSRFEELLDIINDLEKDAFVAKDMPGKHSLLTIQSDFGDEQGLTVTITDGANQETVVLRMVAGDVDLIFCGNLDGMRDTDYLDDLYCWTVDSEMLLLYLQEWMEHPSTIHYWPETG